jgi:hypothetical protein
MNADQMTAVLGHAAAVYSKQITNDLIAAWLSAAGDLPPQLVAAALSEYIREGDWFPKPVDIRRIAIRMRTEQARAANREHLARTGRDLDETALTRGDGPAMLRFVLGRLRAAGSNPPAGQILGADAANKAASDAIDEWRDIHPAPYVAARPGRHCGREACRCTHTQGCEAGWLDAPVTKDGYQQVRPCGACNERRHRVLNSGDPREIAMSNLRVTAEIEKRSRP